MHPGDITLVTARPHDIDADGWAMLYELLDGQEQERAARLVHEEDRNAYVLARALRRCLIASELRVSAPSLRFTQTAQGAPVLIGAPPGLHFSHSHCRSAVACAVTRATPVGVDVERTGAARPEDLERFVSAPWAAGSGSAADAPQPTATHLWTALEAFWKAKGTGLSEANPRISFRPTAPDAAVLLLEQDDAPVAGTASWPAAFDDCVLSVALLGARTNSIIHTHCRTALEIKQLGSGNPYANAGAAINIAASARWGDIKQ